MSLMMLISFWGHFFLSEIITL